ncbi:DnaB-like helicase C-terminal domain-containing protein [Rhodococcoides fascians]|uniref:DnaB-like helicase C-terminal domain-containing protein n=1 Tax=Rhodococcoides fascians TaxID=1828 RepID=UPI00056B3EA6|nr:DnaB-like helicase C-terminal domain-containing protein [Rhodococcus fascians]
MTTPDTRVFHESEELLESLGDEATLVSAILSVTLRHDHEALLASVAAEDFYDPHLGELWSAAKRIAASGRQVSKRLLLAEFTAEAHPVKVRVKALAGEPVQAKAAHAAARAVTELAKSRHLLHALHRAAENAGRANTYSEALHFASEQISGLSEAAPSKESRSFEDALAGWWEWADAPRTDVKTIATPWAEVNEMLAGGLQPGRSYVVGGRPGEGKSIALLNFATHAAQLGHPAVIFSVEMGETEVVSRIMASGAQAEYGQITKRNIDDHNRSKLQAYTDSHRKMPLTLVDKSDITVEYIAAICRTLKRRPEGLDVIVVDYLQLLRESDTKVARERQVAMISRALKILSRELDCSVIVACQLNRNAANQERKPALSELRESGSIEQDADVVILLHHEKTDQGEPTGTVEFVIAKNRTGRLGTVPLLWKAYQARVA